MIFFLLSFHFTKCEIDIFSPHVNRIVPKILLLFPSFFCPFFSTRLLFSYFSRPYPLYIPGQLRNFPKLKGKPETFGRWLIAGILRLNGNLVAWTGFQMWNLCNNIQDNIHRKRRKSNEFHFSRYLKNFITSREFFHTHNSENFLSKGTVVVQPSFKIYLKFIRFFSVFNILISRWLTF